MVTLASLPVTAVSPNASRLSPQAPRFVSVDALCGLVMVIMVLDNSRDFMSYQGFLLSTWRTLTVLFSLSPRKSTPTIQKIALTPSL
jgi:hypothetical protein